MTLDRAQLMHVADELGQVLERVREAKRNSDYSTVGRELETGYSLMQVDRRRLAIEKPAKIRSYLGHGVLVRSLAEVLAHESDLLRLEGDADSAATSARWTLQMLLHGAPPGDYSALMRPLLALAEHRPPPEPI